MVQHLCLRDLPRTLITGILLFLMLQACGEKEEPVDEKVNNGPEIVYVTDPDKILEGPVISFPQQIINIKGGGLLFLKLSVQHTELTPPEAESVLVPRYMDGVIQVASEYTRAQLSKESGKEKLKEDLIIKLNELAGSDATISKIYYESILVR